MSEIFVYFTTGHPACVFPHSIHLCVHVSVGFFPHVRPDAYTCMTWLIQDCHMCALTLFDRLIHACDMNRPFMSMSLTPLVC